MNEEAITAASLQLTEATGDEVREALSAVAYAVDEERL